MRHGIRRLGFCSALAAGTLALAPTAEAVTPTTATINFDCGVYGSGSATLTATQSGTAATINLSTSAIKAPISVGANSVKSTLTLTNKGSGAVTFTGNANPAIPAGSPVSTGPLKGTVAAGDSLAAKSLQVVVFGITATCNATSAQSPGPFVF
ncbi:hypothetical protein OOK13_02025 [Streptomyces sp. NBC_00378]|uniref:hypothetical protein n=1 Tax=unclassified Streptomyces TaxID=2593676 RepID=UPI00225BCD2F|nr:MULTISPECIES: hypothetical protein [unclassified Streptomyces]MCX5107320.1 hypothetical protein [Streptomyces sp. NBC_00378]